ncbi:hypothetical protein [Nocardioides sp.]|uniref:hypothetical protein n=1 Tax=Nocardioides sp. TaxID=35761 RepID=UPI00271DEAF3|nr:hypothetical protein [Nocardioides sp.]MDO9457179.1 hypothetical protein [Nocardioides sp.]
MPTAVSSTEGTVAAARRAVADVGHLLRFRAAHGRKGLTAAAGLTFLALTVTIAVLPAFLPGAGDDTGGARDLLVVLPTALAGFVLLAVVSASASGGGRELLARDPSAIFPISPTTDHLGALLLAPLNIAWMLQAWALLGVTSYAVGAAALLPAQVFLVLWLATGTAFAQVLAWSLEGVRRVPHGISVVRMLTVAVFGVALGLQVSNNLVRFFDQIPTRELVVSMAFGFSTRWAVTVAVTTVALVLLVALGAVPAHIAAHRTPRDELKVESGHHEARVTATTVLGAMVRTDRASVWRAVPMRRGVMVLALGPAFVALLGGLQWETMTILPGLVASGGALLYGVNAWCLDGRGALWRESLPVAPATVFDARAYVLGEFLLTASFLTVLVAGLRAGMPDGSELTALLATMVVVVVQVVGASMRWSFQRPYAVDFRSSRATPAPPAMMVAYSSRLALSTTMTGVLFSLLATADSPLVAPLLAVPLLGWSVARLLRVRTAWSDPFQRARVVTAVAVA